MFIIIIMTRLYNKSDLDILEKNIPNIVKKHKKLKFENVKPNKQEYKRNIGLIKQFGRDKQLVVYGGYAQDVLLKSKNKPGIYNDDSNSDIEFYSPNYLKDAIELAKLFHNKKWGGYLGIAIREATHIGTLSLTVNGLQLADITFVPKHIYEKLPFIKQNGMRLIHPLIKTIDFYRVFNDPYLSYFRLEDKNEFSRFKKNIEAFSLEELVKVNKTSPKIKCLDQKISKIIRNTISKNSTNNIVIGQYALEYYKHFNKKPTVLQVPFYEIISINYIKDVHYYRDELEKIKTKNSFISTKEYYPCFQYTDRKIEFYHEQKSGKKDLVLVIYKMIDKCTPYINIPQKKLDIGSYPLVLLFAFINYAIYAYLFKNDYLEKFYSFFIYTLINVRNEYMKENKKNVLDKTPFEEFLFTCKGVAVDFIRKSQIERTNAYNRKGGKGAFMYRYNPSKDSEPNYSKNVQPLENISGLVITKPTSLSLNQTLN
jgi:hypothetical protein